MQIFLFQIFS